MPEEMKRKMREFTQKVTKQIQDINGNPAYTPEEKAKAILGLEGIPRESAQDFLNRNFRTGPGLSESLAHLVSKGRPRGAPDDSARGTKEPDKKRRNLNRD